MMPGVIQVRLFYLSWITLLTRFSIRPKVIYNTTRDLFQLTAFPSQRSGDVLFDYMFSGAVPVAIPSILQASLLPQGHHTRDLKR